MWGGKLHLYKTINPLVKICLELFVVNRFQRRHLKGKFCQSFLKNIVKRIDAEPVVFEGASEYKIWQYWGQGLENAPDLVRACMASVDKFRGDIERVILTEKNIKDYVEIPEYIYDLKSKGIISAAHFSDILRTFLLYKYGGCWIDATVLMTAPIPDEIKNADFFVLRNKKEEDADCLNNTNYFISSNGRSVILAKMKRFLETYWKEYGFVLNYFFYAHAMTLFSDSCEENKKEWAEMPYVPYLTVQQMERELLNKYSKNEFEKLVSNSPIHKLSYKWKVLAKHKQLKLADTIYQHIIDTYVKPEDYRGAGLKFKVTLLQKLKSFVKYYFSLTDIDDHYILKVFGAKICLKHKIKLVAPKITQSGVREEKRLRRLIVSLTTFPGRINTVWQTISTLLNQTVKPDEVVLWLASEQFPEKNLPENLTDLENFGLTIKWYEEDIRSFKKLVPSLKEYPDSIIVTADDDIFYPENYLESLYNQYLKYPQYIHANRAFRIDDKDEKFVMKARKYDYNETYFPSYRNEFMTGYGSLFPPHVLDNEVLNSKKFMELMPTNDDVWFWGMAVKNNTKVCVNPEGYGLKLMIDRTVQDSALWKLNMDNTTVGTGGSAGVNIIADNYSEVKNNLRSC